MTIRRNVFGRSGVFPRERAAPEHNIIQAPEVLQRLREKLGVRQAHFLPTLAEGVQAVVILDDVSKVTGKSLPVAHALGLAQLGDGATRSASVLLYNPLDSGVALNVRKVHWTSSIGSGVIGAVSLSIVFFSADPNTGADFIVGSSAFFQDSTYSHSGWPLSLQSIKTPIGKVLAGRSISLGVPLHWQVTDPLNAQTADVSRDFSSLRIGARMGLLVRQSSAALTDTVRATFEWTEEPFPNQI